MIIALTLACTVQEDDASARSAPAGPPQRAPERYGMGRSATATEIAAWDIDVNAKGEGLPSGEGTVAQGAVVFAKSCASCHGAAGEGIAPSPRLVGRIPGDSFPFATDVKAVKTIGNYWPYATTLFDYIRRAMPWQQPKTLTNDEVYALTAYLLVLNKVIGENDVMNADTLPRVRMPNRDGLIVRFPEKI